MSLLGAITKLDDELADQNDFDFLEVGQARELLRICALLAGWNGELGKSIRVIEEEIGMPQP